MYIHMKIFYVYIYIYVKYGYREGIEGCSRA